MTEMVTGVDLIAEQIRAAQGEVLRYKQEDIQLKVGHPQAHSTCTSLLTSKLKLKPWPNPFVCAQDCSLIWRILFYAFGLQCTLHGHTYTLCTAVTTVWDGLMYRCPLGCTTQPTTAVPR